jgi:hypothetical protein
MRCPQGLPTVYFCAMRLFVFALFLFIAGRPSSLYAQLTTLNEDFGACSGSLPAGWTRYSVSGTDVWSCTTFGYAGNAVSMNGYSGGQNNTNEDWLITPQLDLSTYSAPELDFWCRTKFSGPFIEVMVSNNYAGSGNPNAATWTPLSATLPTANSDVWFQSGPVNLSAWKSSPMHLAFRYTSTTAAAASWRIDEVVVQEGGLQLSRRFVNAGECGAGFSSSGSTFSFTLNNLSGNLQVQAPSPFELSKDGLAYSSSLSYGASASGVPQTVWVRISPQQAEKIYRKEITFVLNGNTLNGKVGLLGTSLPDDRTLRVLNWNMRWFGDPQNCACDTQLSRQQATRVLQDARPDLCLLQEVVSVSQLASVASALGPNYAYAVSPFGSGAPNPQNSNYAGAQKLGMVYNTLKVQNLGSFGLLASTYPSDTAAYYCFSSGRFPFVMKARLLLQGGQSDTLIIVNLHGKAGNTAADYARRLCASQHMSDSLQALFPGKKVLLAGDFNDYLEGSHVGGQAVSPYQSLLNAGYTGITLPSLYPGQTTYPGTPGFLIDNVVASSALMPAWPDSACFIFTEPDTYIPSFTATTSDHLPVMSYFRFSFPNALPPEQAMGRKLFSLENPGQGVLNLQRLADLSEPARLRLYAVTGQMLYEQVMTPGQSSCSLSLPAALPGFYFVELCCGPLREVEKWQNR